MAIHKLVIEDFEECNSFALIAIHCSLQDYRLAFVLNSELDLELTRKENDLDFSSAQYSIYEWEDNNELITWNLVSNICKIEKNQQIDSSILFKSQNNITATYNLIPEYKSVNYLLKINYQTNFFKEKAIINTLLSIPQIVTAYSIDVENLKTKTNLIFK